ncbi:MAG: hypothetical protein N4A57_01410 [Anaeromicrobium sp.]|jgi:hypothetical protein|uniref:hypothetical protein n=1 Tax=Anaeromicrobium sp. TaxID=1929132 RepID=UPI0025EE202A|nr:hypothetical protein [Anaeromicrobium sp.]MCT4592923.1 hypothetical protein [Anaeromicrobium sp.]
MGKDNGEEKIIDMINNDLIYKNTKLPINGLEFKRRKVSKSVKKVTSNINQLNLQDIENIITYLILSRMKEEGRI